MSTLPIRPDQHAERQALRNCSNCEAHFHGKCRRGAPGQQGWPDVQPTDVCMLWQWVVEPRIGWGSAIAPAERPDFRPKTHEEVPF